jgi:hypothetical protein
MINSYFKIASERVLGLNYTKVSLEDISGSHLLLFLEHYRLRSQFVYKANIEDQYMNSDLLESLDSLLSLDKNSDINMASKTPYKSELHYLNFEYYREKVANILKTNLEDIKNPYEPMLRFFERGGWYYFVPSVGFYVGEVNIRKPKYEFMLQSLPYVYQYDSISLNSYDQEFKNNKDNFITKYIRPSNLGKG